MFHEGEQLHANSLFNLRRGHNDGNQWWITTGECIAIESWKTKNVARHYLRGQNEHAEAYGLKPRRLFRLMPGVGFIEQT